MNKTTSIILTLALVVAGGILFLGNAKSKEVAPNLENNVEVRDGIQYVTISAKGGYSPIVTSAKAGIPTKLIVNTNGTYDCSASLAINSIDYQKILPQTGTEEIDLGVPKVGVPINGVCGMGMYNFVVNFS